MSNPPPETSLPENQWLDQVEGSMRRAGLPKEYTERTRVELADHISESGTAPDQPPRELAAELVQTFRRSGWLRWLPPVVWLLLPLPLAVLFPVLYLVACETLLEALFDLSGSRIVTAAHAVFLAGKVIAPALGTYFLYRLVKRMGRPWFWGATLFLFFALATAATQTSLELSTWEEGEASVVCNGEKLARGGQLPQALLILLTGTGVVLRQRREQMVESR